MVRAGLAEAYRGKPPRGLDIEPYRQAKADSMDNETTKHLWALRKVNLAFLDSLELAIFVLENERELTKDKRKSLIESLKDLIAQSDEIYGTAPATH